jgi:hypothetical protein
LEGSDAEPTARFRLAGLSKLLVSRIDKNVVDISGVSTLGEAGLIDGELWVP